MLGGYIGAGPRKLLERDMVLSSSLLCHQFEILYLVQHSGYLCFYFQVLVSLQYRVGPLGFLCLPDDQIGGNVGLMDQVERKN